MKTYREMAKETLIKLMVHKIKESLTISEKRASLVWYGHCSYCNNISYDNFCSSVEILVSNIFCRQDEKGCSSKDKKHIINLGVSAELYGKARFVGTVNGYDFKGGD